MGSNPTPSAVGIENVRGDGFDDTITGDVRSNLIEGGDGEDYADGARASTS